MKKSEIRKDYFLNNYVIITPGRAKRPIELKERAVIEESHLCVFCPENIVKENVLDYIGAKKRWKVVSLKNAFPAVTSGNKSAYGTQEVIVETPSHTKDLSELSEHEIGLILKMYAKRTKVIAKDKNIDYILCFRNGGAKAGASRIHAHSQIFATKILPPDIQEELAGASLYQAEHGTCPYCDIIRKEERSKRKIFSNRFVVAFTPYASRFHYEAWIFTRRHLDNITKMNADEIKAFSRAIKKILTKLRALGLSYNFFLHQVVSNNNQHFYLKIQPRDSIWGGVELGSGLVINSVSPEAAARFYNK